jgi:hypothetical protein
MVKPLVVIKKRPHSAHALVVIVINVWVIQGNCGTNADLLDFSQKSEVLFSQMVAMSEYVQNVRNIAAGNEYGAMASILYSSGL